MNIQQCLMAVHHIWEETNVGREPGLPWNMVIQLEEAAVKRLIAAHRITSHTFDLRRREALLHLGLWQQWRVELQPLGFYSALHITGSLLSQPAVHSRRNRPVEGRRL